MSGPAEDHRRELSVRERRSVFACLLTSMGPPIICVNGSRGDGLCQYRGPEVAVALQWKRVQANLNHARFTFVSELELYFTYAMMACKREIGHL